VPFAVQPHPIHSNKKNLNIFRQKHFSSIFIPTVVGCPSTDVWHNPRNVFLNKNVVCVPVIDLSPHFFKTIFQM
jgi:hypothetical protein